MKIGKARKEFLLLLVSLIVVGVTGTTVFNKNIHEDIMLRVAPSAERALRYGEAHLDASHSESYDIDRAEMLFLRAQRLNLKLPLVQHQLSRVSFLRGDFDQALKYIENELSSNPTPSNTSHYMRGLILGYMDRFDEAAISFETYLRTDSKNWAAINDYAWVLLKAGRTQEALIAVDWGLLFWPDNVWLLNSKATALFEMGRTEKAYMTIAHAHEILHTLDEAEWSRAYPGNDPLIAREGVKVFNESVEENMHTISVAMKSSHVDVQ